MPEVKITINDRLIIDEIEYLILYISDQLVCLIERNTTKLNISYYSLQKIKDGLFDGSISNLDQPERFIIDEDSLPKNVKEKFQISKAIMQEIDEAYGPSYLDLVGKKSKPVAKAIMENYKMSPKVFWRQIRRYLQSGRDLNAVLDERTKPVSPKAEPNYKAKPGRKGHAGVKHSTVILTPEVKKLFDEAIKWYKTRRQATLIGAYRDMRQTYYVVKKSTENGTVFWEELPSEQIPTYKQFYYYASSRISDEDKKRIKTSKMEVQNNNRVLKSDSLRGVKGPGDIVEVDAMETDVSLVSMRDREKTIGRAILYLMIDVYSRAIIAMALSFENNSVAGMTNLLMNLGDNKVTYASKYGITFDLALWPSNIIPRRVRVDRGAEFRSDQLSAIFNKLGIERQLVTPGSGSMKGIVEQEFRQMQFNQNALLENNGLIEKRHDSKHHKEAKMTINEFTAMCINFVLAHNQKYLQYYRPTKKMLDTNIELIPIKLWEYGCNIYGSPRPISNKEQYLWDLLTPARASLSRKGIMFEGRYYLDVNDDNLISECFHAGAKNVKIDIRFDSRDIGHIYRLVNNNLKVIPLNPLKTENEGFETMGKVDRRDYLEAERIKKVKGQEHNHRVSGTERRMNRQIMDSIAPIRYSDASNMREERAKEKQLVNTQNTVAERLMEEQTSNSVTHSPETTQEVNTPMPAIDSHKEFNVDEDPVDFEKALNDFWNED